MPPGAVKSPTNNPPIGYSGIRKPRVRVALQMFADRFGGKVTVGRKLTKGNKFIYRWNVHCNKAADILLQLAPFLILKKNQALDGIAMARLHNRKLVPKMVPPGTGRRGLISLPLKQEQIDQRRSIAARMVERNA